MRHAWTLVLFLLATTPAHAFDGWETGAHVGYGVAQRTTTGFDEVGGSLAYFDLARRLTDDLAAGMRSLLQGGRGGGAEYYRMGVGPYGSYRVTETISAELALSRFNESALDGAGDRLYRSSGWAGTVGWDRKTYENARLALSWGGFLGWHRGSLDGGRINPGMTRGLALSLAFRPQAQ